MLIILNDPTGATGRQQHPLDHSISLQANIERHLGGGEGATLLINGQVVDPLTDPRLDMPPSVLDRVTVVLRPGASTINFLSYGLIGGAAANALLPKTSSPNVAKDSPNNQLTGQTNVARAYQAVPDVYGFRRVWPDLIQPSTVEYIDHVKYVTEWLCISRGKGTITEVKFSETPLDDIDGASYEVFEPVSAGYPEDGETTLLDVVETFASPEVNGQEVFYSSIVSGSAPFVAVSGASTFKLTFQDDDQLQGLKNAAGGGSAAVSFTYSAGSFAQTCTVSSYIVTGDDVVFTFTRATGTWASNYTQTVSATVELIGEDAVSIGPYTLPLDCDAIRWNTVFLRGLKATVHIVAEWWQVDGAGVEISGTRESQEDVYQANTYDQRFYTVQVTPAAGFGRYRISFTRTDPATGDDVAKLENVYAVRLYDEKVLPGVTVIRVTTKATQEATGISERKFNLYWNRHVRTLTTDTLSASRNFARSIAHLWTISGNDVAELDATAFAAINTEFGETSSLLRFDGSLDDADMSLGERMQLMADSARCVIWRDGTKWTVTRDQARAAPEVQLDYRNLAASGDSTLGYSAHLPASNDGVELEYVDEDTQAKKAYIRLNISSGSVVTGQSSNPKKLKMPGCTTESQADNRAQLEARKLLFQRTTVNDTALSDGGSLGPGSLVRWIDPNDFAGDDGLQAGEVLGISGLTLRTSEPLDWKGETSGRAVFTGANGLTLGPPVRCTPAPGGMTLEAVPTGLYVADASRQLGSRYAFAVGLTDAELEAAGLYTVTEVKPAADGTVSVACLAYDARIYEAD